MTINARFTKCKLSTELVENFTKKIEYFTIIVSSCMNIKVVKNDAVFL